jgi:hypothetical protein
MVLARLAVTVMLSVVVGCVHTADVSTNDLVAVGTVETMHYEPLGDLGANGVFTARLSISRVINGRAPASVLRIKYIAHTNLAQNREFQFHLRRSTEGVWLACNHGAESRGYNCD